MGSQRRIQPRAMPLHLPTILLCIVGFGCLQPTDVEDVRELAGFWVASRALISDLSNPTVRLELIGLGFDVTMDISENGDWVLETTFGTDFQSVEQGTMRIDGKFVTITEEDGTVTGRAFLEGEEVALQINGGQEWDFDFDGTLEPAKLSLVMDRQP